MEAGFILSTAIGSGVVCGFWMGLCTWVSLAMLVGWVGFVGCTSYFASGGGRDGFVRSICSNYAGVAIGSAILFLGNLISDGPIFSALCSGFFTGVICYLAHCDLTKVVVCTFMGGFSTFAAGGDWQMLLLCLMLGNFVGVGSDYLGRWVFGQFFKGRSGKNDWMVLKFLNAKSKDA